MMMRTIQKIRKLQFMIVFTESALQPSISYHNQSIDAFLTKLLSTCHYHRMREAKNDLLTQIQSSCIDSLKREKQDLPSFSTR